MTLASQHAPDAQGPKRPLFKQFVAWSRRATSILLYLVLIHWIATGTSSLEWLRARLLPTTWIGLDEQQLLLIAAVAWYAFLSQLKIRWALFLLPLYLVLVPWWFLLRTLGRFIVKPLFTKLQTIAELSESGSAPSSSRKRAFPTKRLWLLALFLWVIGFRSLQAPWAVWLLPALLFPIWIWLLRLAYRSATSPGAFAEGALRACNGLLDGVSKQFEKAREKAGETNSHMPAGTQYVYGFVRLAMRRYSAERLVAAIHREALAIFSLALLLALVSSAVFWAFVGSAVASTWPGSLHPYAFFEEWRLPEFVLWALGCMTTAVGFPGVGAGIPLKMLHAAVLLTGIFEITYLFASFSIMAAAMGQETSKRSLEILEAVAGRLDGTLREESELRQLIETTAKPSTEIPPEVPS